ncbi:MAG: glycine cleavage system aminomethyltransferase GcvT [Bacilli bacterium]
MSEFKTALYATHLSLGAQMVEYASFLMPVSYSTLEEEHQAVRENCGIFDVSHMGEILIEGKDALKFVNYLIPNEIPEKETSRVIYGMFLNEQGCLKDDLFVYKLSNEKILLVVNAANILVDNFWVRNWRKPYKVKIKDVSSQYGEVALQGPKAKDVFAKYFKTDISDFKFMTFRTFKYQDQDLLVSRSGYTGEDGFEIYGNPELVKQIFIDLVKDYGVVPCGLGCRDTLRFEACLPLYGNETNETTNPYEANLGFGVKLNKPGDFLGKSALVQVQKDGIKRQIVGLKLLEHNIARHGYEVYQDGQKIGYITTGYLAPSLKCAVALAMLDKPYTTLGTVVEIKIRNKMVKAEVVATPFYQKHYAR